MGSNEALTDLDSCDVMISNVYTRYKRCCEEQASRFYVFAPDSSLTIRCDKHRLLSLPDPYVSKTREITREEAVVMSVMEI